MVGALLRVGMRLPSGRTRDGAVVTVKSQIPHASSSEAWLRVDSIRKVTELAEWLNPKVGLV